MTAQLALKTGRIHIEPLQTAFKKHINDHCGFDIRCIVSEREMKGDLIVNMKFGLIEAASAMLATSTPGGVPWYKLWGMQNYNDGQKILPKLQAWKESWDSTIRMQALRAIGFQQPTPTNK